MIKSITVLFLLYTVRCQKPSPCPDILVYEPRNSELDRWYAVVILKSKQHLKGVWLRITLDKKADLLGNVFGFVTSTDNKDFLIRNDKHVIEPKSRTEVNFFVKFNAASTTPSVVAINFNGMLICKRERDEMEIIQDIFKNEPSSIINLKSTRHENVNIRKKGTILDDDQDGSEEYFSSDFSIATKKPLRKFTTPKSVSSDQKCGIAAGQPVPLIINGQSTIPGQWPWHAAIYQYEEIQLKYVCGGTLITLQHILTAAHCVTKSRSKKSMDPQDVLIYLGKHNLWNRGPEIQEHEVEAIFIHQDYNNDYFYNDIAICKLAKKVKITTYVRHVCLWTGTVNLCDLEGKLGTIVGWGFNQNRKLARELQKAEMPVVSTATCIYSNREFFSQFTFEKSFCAGFRNGTSVCTGDSGGGLVFPKKDKNSNIIWEIRGLASVGVSIQENNCVDPNEYAVFTDVGKYLDWIEDKIK